MSRKYSHSRQGFTLLEVLVTIIIIGIASTAIMGVFISTVKTSADPMIQQQAMAIAEAYMEEIRLKPFADPDGIGGETRATFDNVADYNGLSDTGARDQNNDPIAALANYTIAVVVSGQTLTGDVSGAIADTDSLRIDITVSHPAIDDILLSGFRASHF